jgi:anti-anti-sigma regulatory factor
MGSDDQSAKTVCVDVAGLEADAVTLDALARLRLTARQCGFELSLRGSSPELRELIEFAGLGAVLPEEPLAEAPLGLEPGR